MGHPPIRSRHVPVRIPGEIIDTIDIPPDGRHPGHRIYVVRDPTPRKRAWPRLIALGLFLIAVIFTLTHLDSIRAFFETIGNIGKGDLNSDIKGLLAVGFLGVVFVAIARLCFQSEPQQDSHNRRQYPQ